MEARRVETISARVDATSAATGRTAIVRASPSSSVSARPVGASGKNKERRRAELPV